MTEEIKRQLWEWAAAYHCAGFIQNDPVQFPHRYERRQDIEISGLLTAIMSFGNRKQILKKADELHRLMGVSPHQYVLSCQWKKDFPATDRSSFYRMLSYADFHSYFRRLHAAYSAFDSLEDALCTYAGNPMERLCAFLEVSAKSPQKKLNMFLRWMIRKGPEVDFGIWERFDCRDLIVPLDTHVCRVAYALGLTETETFSLKNARRITEALAEAFPDDPCRAEPCVSFLTFRSDEKDKTHRPPGTGSRAAGFLHRHATPPEACAHLPAPDERGGDGHGISAAPTDHLDR